MMAMGVWGGVSGAEVAKIINFFGFEEKLPLGSIDTTDIWTETLVNTGSTRVNGAWIELKTGATINSQSRLVLNMPFTVKTTGFTTKNPFSSFHLSMVIQASGEGNINEAETFVGLGYTDADTRASNELMGIGVTTDKFTAIVDDGGVEDTFDLGSVSEMLIEIIISASLITFKKNGVVVMTSTKNPTGIAFIMNLENDVAAEAKLYAKKFRTWYEAE